MADQTLMEYMCSVRTVAQPLFSEEEMYWSQLVGACEAISAGVTTILDQAQGSRSPAHVERAIDATRESGLRSIYAYFRHEPEPWKEWQAKQMAKVGHMLQQSRDQRITLGLGYDPITWEPAEEVNETLAIAKNAGSTLTTVHFLPTHFARTLNEIQEATHAFSSDFVLSHFNHASPKEMVLAKELGIGIACTPETELAMSHGQVLLFDCAEQGIKAGLGIDTHIMCSGDMFGQMRLALQSARSIRNASLYLGTSHGQPLADPKVTAPRKLPRSLIHTAAHMVRFGTLGGAETLNMDDRIGSLEVGKLADVMLISLSSPNMLGTSRDTESLASAMVVLANASDVKTVIIDGELLKHEGRLTKVDWETVRKNFTKHHKEVDAKIKKASAETDWDKEYEELRKSWGIAPERVV